MFWHLQPLPQAGAGRVEWFRSMGWETVLCPLEERHRRGGARSGDLSIILRRRRRFDFLWTLASELLATAETVNVLVRNGLTGFETKPVTIARRHRAVEWNPTLREVIVTGWGGLASEKAGCRVVYSCPGCKHTVYKIDDGAKLIDPDQWDGSDFFMVWPLPKYIFVSERAAEAIRANRLTGCALTPASELKVEGATPGRLRYYMPEPRAREIGEPLGIY
jgi:hypothetical protein